MVEKMQKADTMKAWYHLLWDALTGPHASIMDAAQRRTAQLLAGISMFIGLIDLLGIMMTPQRFTDPKEAPTLYLLIALAVMMLISYVLSRTSFYSVGIFLTMVSISGLVFASPIIGEKDPVGFALSVLPLSFLLAVGLLSLRGIIILCLVNSLVPFILPMFLPQVTWDYSGTVAGVSMAFGALLIVVSVARSATERDRLAEVRKVNQDLQNLSATLEHRVADRTKDLVLAAEIGRRISTMHNLEEMLPEAVELIRDRFDLYYTQVYLMDDSGRNLILHAGTGEIGKELLRRSHRLTLGQTSINATAAAERRAVVVEDTSHSLIFFPNPLLMETSSEMSVPLISGDQLMGVLDLQSREPGSLSQDNLPVFETLAGQLATALVNTGLFQQVNKSLAEMESRSRKTARQGWEEFLNAIESKERISYIYDMREVSPLDERIQEGVDDPCVAESKLQSSGQTIGVLQLAADHPWSVNDRRLVAQVAAQVAQQVENLRLLGQAERYREEAEEAVRRLTREDWDEYLQTDDAAQKAFQYAGDQVQVVDAAPNGANGAAHVEIKVRDEQIGEFAFPALQNLSPEDAELVAAVGEQLGAHLENIRLYATSLQEVEERRRAEEIVAKRAEQLATVSRLSTLVSTIQSPEEMLQTVVDLTKANFELYHAHIYLLDPASHELVLTKGAGEVGRQMVAEGRRISMNVEKSLVARSARTRQGLIANNVQEDPDFLPHPLLPNTCSELVVPMVAGDVLLGVLDVQADTINHFTEEDIQISTTLASQVAVALENARQYVQTQESERLIRTVIDSTPDWIFIKDQQYRYRLVNQGYANSLHINVEDFIGKTDLELGFPEDYVKGNAEKGIRGYWADDRAVMDSGEAVLFPNDPSMLDGKLHVFNTLKTPLRDQNGNIWGVLAFARDVTEREQMLNQSNRLYNASRRLSEAQDLDEILAIVVESLAIPDFNRAGLFFFEMNQQGELGEVRVGANWYSGSGRLPFAVGERFTSGPQIMIFNNMRTHEPVFDDVTNEFAQRDGVMSGAALPLWIGDRQIGVLALQSEVQHTFTEDEKRPAIALAQQAAFVIQNRLLLEQSIAAAENLGQAQALARMGSWTVDLTAQEIWLSREAMMLVELEPNPDGLTMPLAEFIQTMVVPEDAGLISEHLQYAIEHQNDPDYHDAFEYSMVTASSKRLNLSVSINKKDESGQVVMGTTQDITERKQAELELRRTEQLYRQILDSTPDYMLVKGPKSHIIWANKAFREYYGMSLDQLKDIVDSPIVEPDYTQKYVQDDEYVFNEGKVLYIPEEPFIRYDGEVRPVQTVKAPIFDENGKVVMTVGVMRDITEAKKNQELLAKRAVELATVAEISTRVSTIQQPDEMLQTVVDLTRQAFSLYHAHVYLMDETSEKLILAKGSGETGRTMVAEGRSIDTRSEKSLVARAARTRQGVIVNNVQEDPDFLPHPLLPNTQSEMAVPMIAGDRLLGVIDVQDEQVGRFTPEDINIMTTLSAQVAISLQNARSYARAQRQAEREALINAISERIQATNTVESALQVAVREIGRALGAQHTAIRLGLERKQAND